MLFTSLKTVIIEILFIQTPVVLFVIYFGFTTNFNWYMI
jgi:hypothetical protein